VRSKLRGRNDITPFCVNLHAGTSDDDKAYAKGNKNYHDHPNADPSHPYTRKLIFATNAVESSLTIATIVYVIDGGYCYEESYSPKDDAHSLMLERISQASSNQRKGRAGRTQNGYCYRMYTEDEFKKFKEYNTPDIQKTDLSSKILDMMRLPYIQNVNDTYEKIFKYLIEPPFEEFVNSAIHKLYGLGCIDKEDKTGQITEIGKALAQFRKIELHLAKAILLSYY
jgi:HrpA-like RNA helicase